MIVPRADLIRPFYFCWAGSVPCFGYMPSIFAIHGTALDMMPIDKQTVGLAQEGVINNVVHLKQQARHLCNVMLVVIRFIKV